MKLFMVLVCDKNDTDRVIGDPVMIVGQFYNNEDHIIENCVNGTYVEKGIPKDSIVKVYEISEACDYEIKVGSKIYEKHYKVIYKDEINDTSIMMVTSDKSNVPISEIYKYVSGEFNWLPESIKNLTSISVTEISEWEYSRLIREEEVDTI